MLVSAVVTEKLVNQLCVVLCLVTESCPILRDPMNCSPPSSSVHGHSPGKNTGVGCHALLDGGQEYCGGNVNTVKGLERIRH